MCFTRIDKFHRGNKGTRFARKVWFKVGTNWRHAQLYHLADARVLLPSLAGATIYNGSRWLGVSCFSSLLYLLFLDFPARFSFSICRFWEWPFSLSFVNSVAKHSSESDRAVSPLLPERTEIEQSRRGTDATRSALNRRWRSAAACSERTINNNKTDACH